MYEGDSFSFANELYKLLSERAWNFTLPFEAPRYLREKEIGEKKDSESFTSYIRELMKEILNINLNCFIEHSNDDQYRLNLVSFVLDKLYDHLDKNPQIISNLETSAQRPIAIYIDASQYSVTNMYRQLSFDFLNDDNDSLEKEMERDRIFVTPPEYAREMAICALTAFDGDLRKIDFGDSAIGTGSLFLALKHYVDEVNANENKEYIFNSAIGIDINENMAREAFSRCEKYNLTVIYGDALSTSIDIGPPRNIMIVNPPYNRQRNINKEYRLEAYDIAKKQTGICIAGNADLYVYHLLIMDKWLSTDGIAVWLLSETFLQTNYGEVVRQYLLNNVQLISLHVYDAREVQFDEADISTAIVVFRKKICIDNYEVLVSYGNSVEKPSFSTMIEKNALLGSTDNWRKVLFSNDNTPVDSATISEIHFDDLFEIKRGIATGDNNFFVMGQEKAQKIGIPDLALKPLLPKSRSLKSLIVNSKTNGYPDVEPQKVLIDCDLEEKAIKEKYPSFYEYLQKAKIKGTDGKSTLDRTLVKARNPWYKQEKRDAPLFLLTYMGRNKKDLPPLYFILNKSKAIALNTYLLLYPREWLMHLINKNIDLCESILQSLNESAKVNQQQARIYSGGMQKIEPGELRKLPIVNLPDEVVKAFKKLYT
jgi:hypothetical protein